MSCNDGSSRLCGKPFNWRRCAIKVAFDKKELPALGPGRDALHDVEARYLSDRDGRWHPHLMFFLPLAEPTEWGAGEESAEGGAARE